MKNLEDPELATVFTALHNTGFSVRFLYIWLYGMTPEEAETAWQMYKDEQCDISEQGMRINLNKQHERKVSS